MSDLGHSKRRAARERRAECLANGLPAWGISRDGYWVGHNILDTWLIFRRAQQAAKYGTDDDLHHAYEVMHGREPFEWRWPENPRWAWKLDVIFLILFTLYVRSQ